MSAVERSSPAIDRAFATIGLERDHGTELTQTFGGRTAQSARPTYRYEEAHVSWQMVRGTHADALVAFAGGKSSLSLAAPSSLPIRGHHARLVLRNLPLPFPPTRSAAHRINANAVAEHGIMLTIPAHPRWNLDIQLPSAWQALEDWAHDHEFTVRLSQPGRYGDALLSRLGSPDSIEVLADALRIAILRRLTPESRPKLTQRLAAALADDVVADERELADHIATRIADIGLFLEVQSRTAAEIAASLSKRKRAVLEALAPLVEAGLMQRGRTTACPRCNYTAFAPLAQLDDLMTCRACREQFVLPIIDASGNEPSTTYQLDGLMARVMDQDILPVLLTLRALRQKLGYPDLFFCWPGVELRRDSQTIETDLLVATGDHVYVTEVKSTANNLDQEQLDSLLALAECTEARPVLGGLSGTFDAGIAEAVRSAGGLVLERADLLD